MRVLVTGGCGFIGAALADGLVVSGRHSVKLLDDLRLGQPSDLELRNLGAEDLGSDNERWPEEGRVALAVGDVCDLEWLGRSARTADALVHLAAIPGIADSLSDPIGNALENVVGTVKVLETARQLGIARVVCASSGAPVGTQEPPYDENTVPRPESPYGAAKLAVEGYCSAYLRAFNLDAVALRFSNIYGPGSHRKQSVVARSIRAAASGRPLTVTGSGSQTRDFIHIDDVVAAIISILSTPLPLPHSLFHVSTGVETRVIDLIGSLADTCRRVGWMTELSTVEAGPGEVQRNSASSARLQQLTGWRPRVELAEGLPATVEWFWRNRVAVL